MTSPTPDFEAFERKADSAFDVYVDALEHKPPDNNDEAGTEHDWAYWGFHAGARWARSWVLANDPLVREIYEAALALRNTCMDGELYGDHDKSVALIARVTQALAAYRESVKEK